MASDAIPNASLAVASSNPKDFAKKKRANRSAKLKQCKLDARREQWLSQVKSKGGFKEKVNSDSRGHEGRVSLVDERGMMPMEKLEIKPRVEVEFFGDGSGMHHYCDFESSPSNSPTSRSSSISGSNDSGINFTASSSSSSSKSCFSGSMSEEDEGDDGCLDDWEAMADALAASEDKQQEHTPTSGSGLPASENHGNSAQYGSQSLSVNHIPSTKQDTEVSSVQRSPVSCHAWKEGDTCRPQSLPNLSRTLSKRCFDQGGPIWGRKPGLPLPVPTSCPICYEDLDCTDSSFLPCLCGFRLCLFCHKRILEGDGRCPGCRKQYVHFPLEGETVSVGGSLTFPMARSYSMITRS